MMKRRGLRQSANAALMAVLALGVAACAADTPVSAPPCPEILIPVDGAKLTRFKPGPGRDIIDVVHEELVTGFSHGCEYDTDTSGAGELLVELIPSFEAKRGPANPGDQAQFEYFIAIVDQDKNLLEKKRFPTTIEFPSNMSRVLWQREDAISMRIPLQAGQTGDDFQVFIGLQMTRDELEYQRRIR